MVWKTRMEDRKGADKPSPHFDYSDHDVRGKTVQEIEGQWEFTAESEVQLISKQITMLRGPKHL